MSKKVMLCVLFVLVLVSMLAMAVAGRSRFPLVNALVASVMLPVESGLNSVGNAGNSVRGYWKAMTVMQSENVQLKKDNIELRNANIQMACAPFWITRSSTRARLWWRRRLSLAIMAICVIVCISMPARTRGSGGRWPW